MRRNLRPPDGRWAGNEPMLLADLRGPAAAAAIPKIEDAIARYPYPSSYVTWPGPNSNTFVAWIAREVPELRLTLPSTAIGKDFLPGGQLAAAHPAAPASSSRFAGLLGLTVGVEEGLELNLLGLVLGVDPKRPGDQAAGPRPARRGLDGACGLLAVRACSPRRRRAVMITLNQLRVFWAVAHGESLTRAAKQLGVTQPALSQQLAKLESALGGQLFDRVNNQLVLTDAGRFLLRKAETVLAEIDEAEAGLADYSMGRRRPDRRGCSGLDRAARSCPRPTAWPWSWCPTSSSTCTSWRPAEALEQLYGRNLQLALLSSVSLAANRISFSRVDIARDPYVFAVPRGPRSRLRHRPGMGPDRRAAARAQPHHPVQLRQPAQPARRRVVPPRAAAPPGGRPAAAPTSRRWPWSQAGLGVALVPQLCTQLGGQAAYDVDLYAVPELDRPIVALIPPQYRRAQPFATFLGVPASARRRRAAPAAGRRRPPPFLRRRPRAGGAPLSAA